MVYLGCLFGKKSPQSVADPQWGHWGRATPWKPWKQPSRPLGDGGATPGATPLPLESSVFWTGGRTKKTKALCASFDFEKTWAKRRRFGPGNFFK
ncbi:hypothetical protein ACFX15_008727 [Malus domestica]